MTVNSFTSIREWYKVSTTPNKEPVLHEYFGKVGGHYLCVQERRTQLSLARVFGDLVLFWRFTLDGRIHNISFKIMKDSVYPSGIQVQRTNVEYFWNRGFASYRSLPRESFSIFEKISHLPSLDRYRALLLKMQGEIISYLASPQQLDEKTKRRPRQLPLSDILLNEIAYSSFERAVRLSPEFRAVNERELMIVYPLEKNSHDESSSLFEH